MSTGEPHTICQLIWQRASHAEQQTILPERVKQKSVDKMEEDWDVNKYYNKFEPNEQWEMKKKFMESHKNLFPEERVVCLAQVLVNIEFLGTRY